MVSHVQPHLILTALRGDYFTDEIKEARTSPRRTRGLVRNQNWRGGQGAPQAAGRAQARRPAEQERGGAACSGLPSHWRGGLLPAASPPSSAPPEEAAPVATGSAGWEVLPHLCWGPRDAPSRHLLPLPARPARPPPPGSAHQDIAGHT